MSMGLTSVPTPGVWALQSYVKGEEKAGPRLSTPCTAIVTAQALDPEAFGLAAFLK